MTGNNILVNVITERFPSQFCTVEVCPDNLVIRIVVITATSPTLIVNTGDIIGFVIMPLLADRRARHRKGEMSHIVTLLIQQIRTVTCGLVGQQSRWRMVRDNGKLYLAGNRLTLIADLETASNQRDAQQGGDSAG